jgi:hypothetical protein
MNEEFDYPNGDPDSYDYPDEKAHYEEILEELGKQEIPSGVDTEDCDPDEDEGCLEAQQAKATKEKEASRGNKAMQKSFQWTFPLLKTDNPAVVYGVVYEPCPAGQLCPLDTQGDYTSLPELTKAAHGFLKSYTQQKAGVSVNHAIPAKAAVVESGINHGVPFDLDGQHVPTGAWLAGVELNDPALIKKVQSGELNAFSLGGSGIRTANASRIVTKSAVATELSDLTVNELSLVKSGANMRRFVLLKSDFDSELELEKENMNMEENENEETEYQQALFEKQYIENLWSDNAAEVVRKSGNHITHAQAETEVIHANPVIYNYHQTLLDKLQKAEYEPEVQKSDLTPEEEEAIVTLEAYSLRKAREAHPEVYKWFEERDERIEKGDTGLAETPEQVLADIINADTEGVAEHTRRTSRMHF